MHVPRWLSLLVALWVIVFGVYRLWLAKNPKTSEARAQGKKGMFAMSRSTHLLIGIVYLLLGSALIATSFGWNPLAGLTATEPAVRPVPAKGPPRHLGSPPGPAPGAGSAAGGSGSAAGGSGSAAGSGSGPAPAPKAVIPIGE